MDAGGPRHLIVEPRLPGACQVLPTRQWWHGQATDGEDALAKASADGFNVPKESVPRLCVLCVAAYYGDLKPAKLTISWGDVSVDLGTCCPECARKVREAVQHVVRSLKEKR